MQQDDFEETARHAAERVLANHQLKEELSQVQMIAMAELYEGWALGRAATSWDSAKLVGWATGLRRLAERVGPDWQPSPPDEISLIGRIARAAAAGQIPEVEPQRISIPRDCPRRADEAGEG